MRPLPTFWLQAVRDLWFVCCCSMCNGEAHVSRVVQWRQTTTRILPLCVSTSREDQRRERGTAVLLPPAWVHVCHCLLCRRASEERGSVTASGPGRTLGGAAGAASHCMPVHTADFHVCSHDVNSCPCPVSVCAIVPFLSPLCEHRESCKQLLFERNSRAAGWPAPPAAGGHFPRCIFTR